MNHATVVPGLVRAERSLRLDHEHGSFCRANQLKRGGQADDAAANYDYVLFFHGRSFYSAPQKPQAEQRIFQSLEMSGKSFEELR